MSRAQWRWTGVLAVAMGIALSGPARAQVERIEVVGRVPAGDDAAAGVPPRRAAEKRALAEAVASVANDLVAGTGVLGPDDEEAWQEILGPDPAQFALRYRVLEDLGEGPARDPASSAAIEYAVRMEVHVDAERLARRLEQLGYPVGGVDSPGLPFLLEIRGVSSWSTYLALRRHLIERAGARSALPESFEAGRLVLRVDAPGGTSGLLDRLLVEAPSGLRVEPLAVSEDALAIRLIGRPGPAASD